MAIDVLPPIVGNQPDRQRAVEHCNAGRIDTVAADRLRSFAELLGLPLLCLNVGSWQIVGRTHSEILPVIPDDTLRNLVHGRPAVRVLPAANGLVYFAAPLPTSHGEELAAVGFVLSLPGLRPNDLVIAAARAGWSPLRLDNWLRNLPYYEPDTLRRHLNLVVRQAEHAACEAVSRQEFETIATQLEHTYEEISLLHVLAQNMQISRAPRELAQLSLERLCGVMEAEGHAAWLDDKHEGPLYLVEGQLPFDEHGLLRLIDHFAALDWSRPLVKNYVHESLLRSDFPGLRSFVLTPIAEGNQRFGWLCSCNLGGGQEFGTVEASLLASVASLLGTHGRNLDLYRQHEELLLSFVRSLVSSLDAKDPYTRGHSERVALVARCLGAELGLPLEDLEDIYLSGLLHDIGKIGIDDQILRKPGHLTEEEFEQVKKHPIIGYNIVAGLKNLQAVIPGVRHHHEAYSGNGYPDGLAGEQIPLMARILSVADSYDAMGSDRPYRKGMPLERLEAIFRNGAGDQWDPDIIEAYFACRDSIKHICETYSPSDCALLVTAGRNKLNAASDSRLTPDSVRIALRTVAESPL